MSVKTHVYIDGSWMFHNKKFLVEAYGEEDYDVDYKNFYYKKESLFDYS